MAEPNASCSNELLAIIDWQIAHAGNPMEDLARLLVSSCPVSMRRQQLDTLIGYYYERCTHYYGAQLPFTIDNLHRAYKFVLPYAIAFYLFRTMARVQTHLT